ncbi:hypothetical protein K474DRAFT_185349 [Panus rudis PR-1116 ss-1]|nr:hypothetical protein K474DRAFT_185349 [Panus rudis PR-1116 ss-1]
MRLSSIYAIALAITAAPAAFAAPLGAQQTAMSAATDDIMSHLHELARRLDTHESGALSAAFVQAVLEKRMPNRAGEWSRSAQGGNYYAGAGSSSAYALHPDAVTSIRMAGANTYQQQGRIPPQGNTLPGGPGSVLPNGKIVGASNSSETVRPPHPQIGRHRCDACAARARMMGGGPVKVDPKPPTPPGSGLISPPPRGI